MNIHPIFVHFPIALMTLYAIAELIRHKKLADTVYWFHVKAILVITGTLTAFLALSTGDDAEHLLKADLRPLINMHANFAAASTLIFGFIALIYLIVWIKKSELDQQLSKSLIGDMWKSISNIANYILKTSTIMIVLALIGLIAITITGGLGGAIVYGPNVDPIVGFIYHLFF
ncbi:MAG: hypothetical protein KGI58_01535 [Patescibacteria group bacterium]|nr:hypothetical protein [Patescibacteria group bacterium]